MSVIGNHESRLLAVQQWLIADQFEYGEWGKCEITDPTSSSRTAEQSRLKANVFTSCQAAYALVATGLESSDSVRRFLTWMNELRDSDGYWVSASGSSVPMGNSRGWSEVRNLRHTAKGLDLLLLKNEFVADDAGVFKWVIGAQLERGAYPDLGGKPDIWATAYVMNMLIRALHSQNLTRTVPRGLTTTQWQAELENHLGRAREWLCGERGSNGLWDMPGRDPLWITRGVLAEVGAHIKDHNSALCQVIASALLNDDSSRNDPTCAWALLLVWDALRKDQQREVLKLTADISSSDLIPANTFSTACLCRLMRLSEAPQLLQYYLQQSSGHESCLVDWKPWLNSEYEGWSVQRARSELATGACPLLKDAPQAEFDAWLTIVAMVEQFRHQIEQNRGWELLWTTDGPRDENAVQVAFYNITIARAQSFSIHVLREPETGRGPVDFEFSNGMTVRTFLEFKLTTNPRILEGLNTQLPTHMRAQGVRSGIFVCIGFDDKATAKYARVKQALEELASNQPDLFLHAEFIDARRRSGASLRTVREEKLSNRSRRETNEENSS